MKFGFGKGYVEIVAEGYFLERFLNLCLVENILLLNVSKIDEKTFQAKISIKSFKAIRPIAFKTRTKIKIRKKCGLPFILKKYKKRRGVFFGFLIFCLSAFFLSTHIIGITVEGNEKISREEIIASLNSYGVGLGTPIKKVNPKILKYQLMTSNENLGWIGVTLKGSRLYLNIKERIPPKKVPDSNEPCNLIASKDGILKLAEIRDGQTMVLMNTPVKKGDLLVSGIIDSNTIGMRYTHSYGEVYALTQYNESIEIPFKYNSKKLTGDIKKSKELVIFNHFIPLSLPLKSKNSLFLSHKSDVHTDFLFDISIKSTTVFYQKKNEVSLSVSEAENLGKFQLLHRINLRLAPKAIFDKIEFSTKINQNSVTVFLKCECIENIAVKSPIDKTDDL